MCQCNLLFSVLHHLLCTHAYIQVCKYTCPHVIHTSIQAHAYIQACKYTWPHVIHTRNFLTRYYSGNTEENLWQKLDELPAGGYLDDLWYYDQNYEHGQDGFTVYRFNITIYVCMCVCACVCACVWMC